MLYILLYFLVGSSVAFLDRSYIRYNAIDLAMCDFQDHNKIIYGRYFKRWAQAYLLAFYAGEIIAWPYILIKIGSTQVRKLKKEYEESKAEDPFD